MRERCALHIKTLNVFFCQDAPHLTIDDKLKAILKATAGGSLQYVVIEGKEKEADIRFFQLERLPLSLMCISRHICVLQVLSNLWGRL